MNAGMTASPPAARNEARCRVVPFGAAAAQMLADDDARLSGFTVGDPTLSVHAVGY
jgi:hypothetical protein